MSETAPAMRARLVEHLRASGRISDDDLYAWMAGSGWTASSGQGDIRTLVRAGAIVRMDQPERGLRRTGRPKCAFEVAP